MKMLILIMRLIMKTWVFTIKSLAIKKLVPLNVSPLFY